MKFLSRKLKTKRVLVSFGIVLLSALLLTGTIYALTGSGVIPRLSHLKADIAPVGADVPAAEVGDGAYNITVNTVYEDAVSGDDYRQTVEIYNDTAQAAAASGTNAVSFAMPAENTSPTLNVKSSSKVSVTEVKVYDSGNNDITTAAFGGEAQYAYFIESTKTSLFGYFELQDISGDITVTVTYGEPLSDLGKNSSSASSKMYSITVVTKGEVGSYKTMTSGEHDHAVVGFSGNTSSNRTAPETNGIQDADYTLDTTYGTGKGNSGFTFGSYKATGQCSNYDPGDGTQMTRYAYGKHDVTFDYNDYSYVSDIKAYYNDGSEASDVDVSALVNKRDANKLSYNYQPTSHEYKNITFVVTYTAQRTRAVYTAVNYAGSNLNWVALTCPQANDYQAIFRNGTSSGTYSSEYTLNDNSIPVSPSNNATNRVLIFDTDKIRYGLLSSRADRESLSISNIHIYSLNTADHTAPTEITSQFDGKITYNMDSRTVYSDDQYVDIDLSGCDDDVYVTMDVQYYNTAVSVRTSGAHTEDLIITPKNGMGALGAYTTNSYGQLNSESLAQVSLDCQTNKKNVWFYGGADYVLSSSGDSKLTGATLQYSYKNGTSTKSQTDTFGADENGNVTVTFPTNTYYKHPTYQSSDANVTLTAQFEPISTGKAQVYIGYNGENATFNSADFVRVTTVDGSDAPQIQMFRESSNVIQAYSSETFKSTSPLPSVSNSYQIEQGARVKVEYVFDPANNGSNYAKLTDDQKAFVDKRIEFKGFKISYLDSKNNPTTVIKETNDSVKTLYFDMPSDGNVRIKPVFYDHVHFVNILASDTAANGNHYLIDSSPSGSASLVAKENTGSYFIHKSWRDGMGDNYHTSTNLTDAWSASRFTTVDGTQFTLTVSPALLDSGAPQYNVKSVKAYVYTSGEAARNKTSNMSSSTTLSSTSNWLTFSNGAVTNAEIPGVVGELSEPDDQGVVTCDITLPRDMDRGTSGSLGNVVLYVEFEEYSESTIYAPFKYEVSRPSGASSFNPRTIFNNANGEIMGKSEATYTATTGMDERVVYYDTAADEADRKTVTLTIGGNAESESAFYYTNLVYTLTSYDETIHYGSFRYFKDQWYPVDDTALSTVIDLSQNAVTDYSGSTGACSAWTMNLKVPKEGGLKVTCSPQETYVPLTISQYVIDDSGSVSAAGNDCSATVTAYGGKTDDDWVKDRFFKTEYTEDYYAALNVETGYSDTFTVTGAQAQHNVALYKSSGTGYYISPDSIPEGYELVAIDCKAYNRSDATYSGSYENDGGFYEDNRPASISKDSNGYRIRVVSNSRARSWRQEVKVYYARTAKLTIHQHLNEVLSNDDSISDVQITNDSGTLADSALTPFIDESDSSPFTTSPTSSYSIKRNNKTTVDGTEYTWERSLTLNRGVITGFSVNPNSTHSIANIKVYQLVDNEEVDVAYTKVSGPGVGGIGSKTVYRLDAPAQAGDDIHIDITYATESTLRVTAYMYNSSNTLVANDPAVTKATVTVTATNSNLFHREGSDEEFESFTVNSRENVQVNPSTNLKIETIFSEESPYYVANVRMRTGSNLNDANHLSWVEGVSASKSTTYEGNTVYNYEECTVNGVNAGNNAGKNTEIIVYLVRTAPLNVAVYTYDTGGVAHAGVPNRASGTGTDTGSYVNVSASVNNVTDKAFITLVDEGNYNTGDFHLTYGENNSDRSLSVIQGAKLNVYAMLPESGDYVIKEITGAGISGSVGEVTYSTDDSGTRFLKTTVNTNGTIYPDQPGGYNIKIYIAPAKSIITRSRTANGENYIKPNGTVTVFADDVASGTIPFTQIYPTAKKFDTSQYTASSDKTDSTNPDKSYTTEAKTISGTKLHFDVKANTDFVIDTVNAYMGSFGGQEIKLRRSSPAADGTVTYTLVNADNTRFTMPELQDVYIDVVFATKNTGSVTLDYQYTDDYTTWQAYFGNKGVGKISASNSNSAYKDVLKLTDANNQFANTFEITSGNNLKYSVVTGSSVQVSVTHLNSLWYMPIEAWITNSSGEKVSVSGSTSYTGLFMSYTVHTDDDLTFHARFIPVAQFLFKTTDNNVYDGSPEGVITTDKTYRKALTVNAANTSKENAIYTSANGWTNSAVTAGQIAKGSTINDLVVDMRQLVYPGNIKSVNIYQFEKNASGNYDDLSRGTLIAEMVSQHGTLTYTGDSIVTGINSGASVGSNTYTPENTITVDDQKVYVFYVEYDVIDVYTNIYGSSSSVRPYLVKTDDKDNFVIDRINSQSGTEFAIPVTLGFGNAKYDCQFSRGIADVSGPLYYVIESTEPRENLSITAATFKDYKDNEKINILNELKKDENYRTVVNRSGAKRYYYIYKISPADSTYPVDNSMEFNITLKRITTTSSDVIPSGEVTDNTAYVTVTQYDRVAYNDYTVSSEDKAVVSHTDGSALKIVGSEEEFNSVEVPNAGLTSVQLISEKKKVLKFDLTPRDGYNVEKLVIEDGGKTTLYPKNANPAGSDTYYHTVKNANVTVSIYYARPIMRVTATNTASRPNAAVSVIDEYGNESVVLKSTDYTKDTEVTKGEDKILKISPVTYQTESDGVSVEKKYTIDYIAVGDAYDNVMPIYDESKPNPNISSDYEVEKDNDGNYTVSFNNIQNDVYVFIQLMGETRILTSALEVRHHIYDVELGDYVNCGEDNLGGTVTTYGVLSGTDDPLISSDGEECSSIVLNSSEYSVQGGALAGTSLSFDVADVPENFKVDRVEGKYGDSSTVYTAYLNAENRYQFSFTAPNSGVLYVDVYYSLNLTDYQINYVYQGRKGGNDGSYDGDDAQSDTKTYTTVVQLTDTYIKDGKPIDSVLVDNAPAVEDLYKDCVWTIDSSHVTYGEDNTVTVEAVQPARKYTVRFYYGEYKTEPFEVEQVTLNELVRDNSGNLITAPAKDGDNDFAYWKVEENGAEIARCESRMFNLRVTGDLTVTACYTANAQKLFIGNAEYSREQTTDEHGNVKTDKLYADFILSYMEENGELLNPDYENHTDKEYKTGLIVEFDNSIRLQKADEPGATLSDEDKAAAVYEANDVLSAANAQKLAQGETLTDAAHRYIVYSVANDKYNNHNRVDKAISFSNSETARHLVLRAYYYVWNVTDNTFEMTDPVYFYLYDIGNSVSNTSVN